MSLEHYSDKRVLIVDTLENFRFATKNALMSLGIRQVDTSDTASKAITAIKSVDYDVVLCNFDLGKGKNGQELLEELRFRKLLKFKTIFLIVTGEVAKDKVMGTIENEPDGYLVKPITPLDLEKRLIKLLDQKEEMREINQAIDSGDLTMALKACDRTLESNPRYRLSCLKTKAWLLTKLGETQDAKALYRSIVKKYDAKWAEYALAKLCIADEEYPKAQELLEDILDKDENRVEAMDLLAQVYEAQGKLREAQKTIAEAIRHSPNVLLRQKHFADLCLLNGDIDTAHEAFRKVIKLGEQSIYARPEQYFDFAEQLTEQYKDQDSPAARKHIKEAFELLGKAKKRFADDKQIEYQAGYSEASLHYTLGEAEKAEGLLEEINKKLALRDEELTAHSARVAAKTLIKLGKKNEAEQLLEAAADKTSDPELISDIYNLMKSQISLEDRQKAAQLNKAGIRAYNEGNIEEAAASLLSAIGFTPRHISLNLNLVQVLLKRIKSNDKSNPAQMEKDLSTCKERFNVLRHVPKTHKEYKRLQYLKKQFDEIA